MVSFRLLQRTVKKKYVGILTVNYNKNKIENLDFFGHRSSVKKLPKTVFETTLNVVSEPYCRQVGVLNFGQVGGHRKNFQNHTATMIFFKNGLKSNFWKNFKRDFPVKNEENFLFEIFT